MAITQVISAIPQAGHRGVDARDTFVTKQEEFQDALTNTFVTEINAFRTQANTLETNVNTKEASASIARDEAVIARNEAVGAASSLPDGIINDNTITTLDTWSSSKINSEISNINTDLVNDTTPQLGGNLDLNGNDIPVSKSQLEALQATALLF